MTSQPTSGFTYIEALLAIVILAGAVISMGFALEHSRDVGEQAGIEATGHYLLQDGITWARMLARTDAVGASSFGRETGETTVADVDDVDDLDGIIETAPKDRTGTAFARWQRSWSVACVDLGDPSVAVAAGSTALMRIRITIRHDGAEVAAGSFLLSRTP